jgi:hypothetical protein
MVEFMDMEEILYNIVHLILKEGQLGNGDLAYKFVSTPLANITSGVTKIDCGYFSSIILHSNYTCFGKQSSVSVQCSGNGLCVANDQCICHSNYFGNECQFTTCFGKNSTSKNVCSGQGNCTNLDTCTCNTNFGGSDCQFGFKSDPNLPVVVVTGNNNVIHSVFNNSMVNLEMEPY